MRVPGLALSIVLTCAAPGGTAAAAARVLVDDGGRTAATGGETTALHLVADDAAAPVEGKGDSGWLAGLTAGGLGCLACGLPAFGLGFLGTCIGPLIVCPGTLVGMTGFAALGALVASLLDGGGFWSVMGPTLVGAGLGLVGGALTTGTMMVVVVIVSGGLVLNQRTDSASINTADRAVAMATLGIGTVLTAVATGIGTAVAYGMATGGDEPSTPSEVDATPPVAETAPPQVDQPRPEDSQPKPADTQPKPEDSTAEPPAEQPAADDPDMKGFFY